MTKKRTQAPTWTKNPANFVPAIKTLAFEVYHLRMFQRLCSHGLQERRTVEASGKIYDRSFYDHAFESCFYLHLRNVVAFFYPGPIKDDDILWEDFNYPPFPMQKPFPTSPDPAQVDVLRENLHKRVAHLTAHRFLVPQPASAADDGVEYYLEFGVQFDQLVRSFVESLHQDLQGAFAGRMQSLEDREREKTEHGPEKHFQAP